jgi:tetratricopeptide (TPR) repeat protein
MPSRVGDYELRREIGRGGMGVVYEAIQRSIDRPVALKLLHTAFLRSSDAIARFRREARAAGRLRHRNIVPIRETGRERGVWYIAMELVDGAPLNRVIQGLAGKAEPALELPEGDEFFRSVAERFADVADALQAAHKAGVIHRDIKPANLILSREGPLMIVDFGLARLTAAGSVTATGSMLGTPEYMSPEQALVTGTRIDHRTDIYSLSTTLYEVLTLQPAFRGTSVAQVCAAIASSSPPTPRSINALIPKPLENIVLRGMARAPAERYQTAGELADDLRRFVAGEKTDAQPPRRRWMLPAMAILATAIAAVILIPREEAPEPPVATDRENVGDSYALALRLESEGKLEESLEAIEKAVARSGSAKKYSAHVRILMELGRDDELLAVARKYREADTHHAAAVTRLELSVLRALGKHAEAKKLAQEHLDSGRKGRGVPTTYLLAVAGHEDEARKALGNARKNYFTACVASALNDREATLKYLERAIAEGESIPPGAQVEPDLRIWEDDTAIQAALDRMRKNASRTASRPDRGDRRKALALEAAGELDAALAMLDEACKSNNLPSHAARVRVLMELGRYEEMLRRSRESQQAFKRSPGLVRMELVALRALGRHKEARTVAEAQQKTGQGMPYSRAYSAAVLGNEKDTRQFLKSANQQPYQNAWIYSILKDREGTIRSLETAKAQGELIPPNSKLPPDLAVWADDKEIQKLLAEMRAE